jgi:DNA-directed RNA polymerase specialized sigma24 family protein
VDPAQVDEIPEFRPAPGESPRDFVARYVLANAEKIRAIARRKIPQRSRAATDSEDVLSSVLRRLDEMGERGTLRLDSELELWGLIEAMASNAAVSKVRMIERARNFLTEDAYYANLLLARLQDCAGDDDATLLVLRMTASLKSPEDRQILTLMHRGASHRAIGDLMGFTEQASRQRWKRIRGELCGRFQEGGFDG